MDIFQQNYRQNCVLFSILEPREILDKLKDKLEKSENDAEPKVDLTRWSMVYSINQTLSKEQLDSGIKPEFCKVEAKLQRMEAYDHLVVI